MARQTSLANLLLALKAKLGESSSFTGMDAMYKQLLADKQKWLAGEYDFPYLETRWDVTVNQNDRYISFPTQDVQANTVSLNLERPILVEALWNLKWHSVSYGITSREYNYLNSDLNGQRIDPVQKWQWRQQGTFEIWPRPNTSQTIRFTGQRAVGALAADGDTADLDDALIVLAVASDLLLRSKQADSQLVLAEYQERLRMLRGSYPTHPKGLVFGDTEEGDKPRKPHLIHIAVAGN